MAFMGGPSIIGFSTPAILDEPAFSYNLGGSFVALDFSLLGKLPFVVGRQRNSAIFPLLGIGYNLVLSATYDDESVDTPSDLSTFRLQFGLGADFGLSETMFIRTSLLGAYRFAPRYIRDIVGEVEQVPFLSTDTSGWGVTFKIGLGFRL
jgi:hypothetical protein